MFGTVPLYDRWFTSCPHGRTSAQTAIALCCLPAWLRMVEVKEDDEGRKLALDGCKMVHVYQRRPVGRGRSSKYGKDSRYAYIISIAHKMKLSPNILVSGVEGRIAYHEANGKSEVNSLHVAAHMKELRMYCDGLSCFALLLTCSVPFWHCSFTDVQWAYSKDPAGYHSLSCSQTISAIEELIELTSSLAESIPQFQELSQNNVSAPDIAIHVRMDFKSLPEPNWSAEKTDAFYYNKLILVLDYLKCSGLVGLSPQSNEMKCINALLDYVTSVHLPVKKESEVCDPFYAYEPVGATTRNSEVRKRYYTGHRC